MLTQTRYTTDEAGNVVQVAVDILTDRWEPLCGSSTDVGPFDDVEVLTSELQLRLRSWGATLRYPEHSPAAEAPQPALPFP